MESVSSMHLVTSALQAYRDMEADKATRQGNPSAVCSDLSTCPYHFSLSFPLTPSLPSARPPASPPSLPHSLPPSLPPYIPLPSSFPPCIPTHHSSPLISPLSMIYPMLPLLPLSPCRPFLNQHPLLCIPLFPSFSIPVSWFQ